MARFTVAARRASDRSLPEHVRFLALLWAIDSYTALTGETFHGTYERMGTALGFSWSEKPTADQIVAATSVLMRERKGFLAAHQAFAAKRKEEKRARRQRQPSRSQLRGLYFGSWFVVPGTHRKISPNLQQLVVPVV